MNGEVNTQNVREYAPREIPPIFIMTETTVAQKSLSELDYAVMEHLQAHSCPVNVYGENYLQMMNEEVFPQLMEMFGDQFEKGTFQRL